MPTLGLRGCASERCPLYIPLIPVSCSYFSAVSTEKGNVFCPSEEIIMDIIILFSAHRHQCKCELTAFVCNCLRCAAKTVARPSG